MTPFIDAGHGGGDPGAVFQDLTEERLALRIALQLIDICEHSGVPYCAFRKDGGTSKGLTRRRVYALRNHHTLAIHIHINAAENEQAHGIRCYYLSGSKGKIMSDYISTHAPMILCGPGERSITATKARNPRAVNVLNVSPKPAVLVECGFITNKADRDALQDGDTIKQLASCMFAGMLLLDREQGKS